MPNPFTDLLEHAGRRFAAATDRGRALDWLGGRERRVPEDGDSEAARPVTRFLDHVGDRFAMATDPGSWRRPPRVAASLESPYTGFLEQAGERFATTTDPGAARKPQRRWMWVLVLSLLLHTSVVLLLLDRTAETKQSEHRPVQEPPSIQVVQAEPPKPPPEPPKPKPQDQPKPKPPEPKKPDEKKLETKREILKPMQQEGPKEDHPSGGPKTQPEMQATPPPEDTQVAAAAPPPEPPKPDGLRPQPKAEQEARVPKQGEKEPKKPAEMQMKAEINPVKPAPNAPARLPKTLNLSLPSPYWAPAYAPKQDPYLEEVVAYFEQHKRLVQTSGLTRDRGSIVLFLTIDRNGQVVDIRVAESSGDPAFDAATVHMIQAVAPFPAPPVSRGSRVDLVMPLAFMRG